MILIPAVQYVKKKVLNSESSLGGALGICGTQGNSTSSGFLERCGKTETIPWYKNESNDSPKTRIEAP